jgi:hypothetical protein
MTIARGAAILLALVPVLVPILAPIAGCARDTMLLEGDIPLPRGMTTVRSADIRRNSGEVTGGTFLLSGDVPDARSSVDLAATRFAVHGWSLAGVTGDASMASARFTKNSRSATLMLRRRDLEPVMSTGSLEVTTTAKP